MGRMLLAASYSRTSVLGGQLGSAFMVARSRRRACRRVQRGKTQSRACACGPQGACWWPHACGIFAGVAGVRLGARPGACGHRRTALRQAYLHGEEHRGVTAVAWSGPVGDLLGAREKEFRKTLIKGV